MKKRILALVLALIIAIPLFVASVPVFANGSEPATAIAGHNLALQDTVYLMYYVTVSDVPVGAETGVLIWTGVQDSYIYGTETAKALYVPSAPA